MGTLFLNTGGHNIPTIRTIVSLLIALTIGFFVWKQTGKGTVSNGLLKYIIIGGIILGSIGLIGGILGPIILNPSGNNNQAPLLGILITGPIGFLIGLIGGGVYWRIKVKIKEKKRVLWFCRINPK